MTTPATPPCSVVIVDDNPDDRFLIARLLSKAGIALPTLTASGGAEAMALLEKAAAGPAARFVVLLDLKMPSPNGFEVTRWLRTNRTLRGVKVVILTNSDDPRDRTLALELGADRYLVKNPHPQQVAAMFRELLQR